jgi:hypothetical protein
LLVFIDCSAISVRAHERLFMPNRENLRHGDLKFRLETEIEDKLRHHAELESIAIARRKGELSENPEVSETFEKFVEDMVKKHPLLEQVLGPGFRISNPFKPHAVEAVEKEWEGVRFPTKFHFRDREPRKSLEREAHINSQTRITFVTDAENDYFKRDEQPGVMTLCRVIDDQLLSARNWRSPTLFEGKATLSLSLPSEGKVGDIVVYEAHVMDPSRIEPFVNRFSLSVKAEREAAPPNLKPSPPKPDKPGDESGSAAQQDTKLNVPNPAEVWEKDWGVQQPAFDKFTAMRIKRPPGADEGSAAFDYVINMNNVFIDQAVKEKPRRVQEFRDRYKFGMTLIALAVIRHDLEKRKRDVSLDADEEEEARRPDVREMVEEVTSAIAPFLLPLVDSLSRITGPLEHLSSVAGEAA